MKIIVILLFVSLNGILSHAQSVSINEDASVPDPSALLDIKSSSKGLLIPRMSSAERTGVANAALGLLVYDNETESFWYYKATGWTELATGGGSTTNFWDTDGTHIYNNNTGNVGIGTLTPLDKLTVETDNNSYGITHRSIQGNILSTRIGGTTAGFGTFSPTDMRIFSGGLSRVFISQATGEVFIGTDNTSVGRKLTVQTLNNSDGISHIGEGGNILSTRIGGTSAGIGTFSNTHMRIFCKGRSDIFIAEATGNVGIGYENFGTYKLAVNGSVRSKEVVVEETGWADYVFDKKYKLPSLDDVEKFIQQNKHLPNIPSAKEVEEKGLHLGDMQKKMMEKIEELTLYVIEANKQLQKTTKEVATLKTELGFMENTQRKN